MSKITRYSDADLAEFKAHIDQKIEKGTEYLRLITEQIQDANENKDSEGDWMDDTSATGDLEMLFTMQSRQRKHLNDLENALLRIRSKSYGICIVTGALIDRRRLMAVPTTSQSLEAKTAVSTPQKKARPVARKRTGENQIISKVIKKTGPVVIKPDSNFLDEDDDLYEEMEEGIDMESASEIDFDSIAAEDD